MSNTHGRGTPLAEQIITDDLRILQENSSTNSAHSPPGSVDILSGNSTSTTVANVHDEIIAAKNHSRVGGTNRVANKIILLEEFLS